MTEKLSLLLELDESDYQIVIDELMLIKRGVQFHYAIDLYDISEYCYPFGLKEDSNTQESKEKKHIDFVADEQYAMYQLFNSKNERVFLLDEYLVELLYFKKFIKYAIENGIQLVNTLKKYEDEFYSDGKLNTQKEKNLEYLIHTKLTILLSYLIDLNSSGIQKLISLFKENKIILDEDDFEDNSKEELIKTALVENRGSDLTEIILEKIWRVDPTTDKTDYDKNVRYTSRKRDAKVIDRIININKFLAKGQKEFKKKQRVLLYLSSTSTSKEFFQKDFIQQHSIVIDNIVVNPLRNKAQVFLKALCFNEENLDESISNVEYLRNKILNIKKLKELIPVTILRQDINATLSRKFNYYREKFETYAVLNQYQKIADLVESTLKKVKDNELNSSFTLQIMPVLNKLVALGNQTENEKLNDLISLDNWENQVKYTYYIKKTIERLGKQTEIFRFNTGKDPIRSTIHHLPIIYKITTSKNSDATKGFKEIIERISSYIIKPFSTFSTEDIKALTKETFDKTIELQPSLEERLVKALVLLLIPEIDEIEDTNKLAYDWTNSILLKEIQTYPLLNELNAIESDYMYFVSWAARRCKDYPASKTTLTEALKKYPNDARFYHGMALIDYCIFEDIKNTSSAEKINALKGCIGNAIKAQTLFLLEKEIPVVDKTLIALNNTIGFFYAEIYRINNDFSESENINKARYHINELKKGEPEYQNYPEYLHTESFIELLEYKHISYSLLNDTATQFTNTDAHYKIHCSLIAIVSAIEESVNRSSTKSLNKYKDLFNEIKTAKNKLNKDHPLN